MVTKGLRCSQVVATYPIGLPDAAKILTDSSIMLSLVDGSWTTVHPVSTRIQISPMVTVLKINKIINEILDPFTPSKSIYSYI